MVFQISEMVFGDKIPLFFADPEFKREISSVVDREKSVKARFKRRTLHELNLIPIKVDPNN